MERWRAISFSWTGTLLALLALIAAAAPAVAQQATPSAQLVGTVSFGNSGGAPGLRLGDLNGDGKLELVMGQPIPQPDAHTPQEVVRVTAFSLTGTQMWQYTRPDNPVLSGHGASSDIPLQVYDLDGDGAAEVIAAMGKTALTILDGRTGAVKRTIPLPQGTSASGPSGSNDCIVIANLRGTAWPQDFVVKTRYTQVWGINGQTGEVLWTSNRSGGDNLAHFGYAFNADADPMDEYLSGWQLLDHDGRQLWRASGLSMHLDAVSVGDIDGDLSNGVEIAMASQNGVLVNSKGQELWRDRNVEPDGQGIQHIAIGDFSPNHAGKETVMLERIGPRTNVGRDALILVDSKGQLIWKERRTGTDYGWVSVTERITNWGGTGKDQILAYRRGSRPPAIYGADGNMVVTFAGGNNDLVMHADLCGDAGEEVVVYNANTARIFSHAPCDLAAPPRVSALPQNRRQYNWSIYSGWDAVDHTFYTPGSSSRLALNPNPGYRGGITSRRRGGTVQFLGLQPGENVGIYTTAGRLLAQSGAAHGGEWTWRAGDSRGVFYLRSGSGVLRALSVE